MRQKWLDFLKAIAMIAVLQNHLPAEAQLFDALYSIYSVSLFILLGGIASAISLQNQTSFEYRVYLTKKVQRIILPYLIATCGYTVFEIGYLDIFYTLNRALTFTAGSHGHMYYLVFYLELILIAPLLVRLYKNCEKNEFMQGLLLIISAVLSYLFQKYTYLEPFLSGGKFLFGGSYFFLFNLGIYFYFHINILDKIYAKILVMLISSCGIGYMIYRQWALVWWSNPPSVKVILYTTAIFLFAYCSITLIQTQSMNRKIRFFVDFLLNLFCFPGRYSFYIYLWHMMLLDTFARLNWIGKSPLGFPQKIAVTLFILFFPCFACVTFQKGKKILQNYWC